MCCWAARPTQNPPSRLPFASPSPPPPPAPAPATAHSHTADISAAARKGAADGSGAMHLNSASRAYINWQALMAVGGASVVPKYPSALTVVLQVMMLRDLRPCSAAVPRRHVHETPTLLTPCVAGYD